MRHGRGWGGALGAQGRGRAEKGAMSMVSAPIQAVLFDLDDTLFDHQYSTHCALRGLQQLFPQLADIPLSNLVAVNQSLLDTLHGQVLCGTLTFDTARQVRFAQLLQYFAIPATDADSATCAAHYRTIYQAERRAIPGVLALLQALRPEVQLGIITNNLAQEQYEKLHVCGLESLFDCVIISAEVGLAKPDPAIFQLALERLHCAPQHAVMVGDSWTADIVPAATLELHTIWLNRYAKPCPDPALTTEISAFEPLDSTLRRVLQW